MKIIEALNNARDLLQQDGWDEGDLIYADLTRVINRLHQTYPHVAHAQISQAGSGVISADDAHHLPLAKYLSAAYTAHRLGISLTYAYKQYVKEQPTIGRFWLDVARLVDEGMMHELGGLLAPPPVAPGIQ